MRRIIHNRTLHGCFIVGVLWYLLHLSVGSGLIPGPVATFTAFFRLLQGGLLLHMAASLLRIFIGLSFAVILGVPLGLWMGFNRKADALLAPVAYILYPLPKIAFLPVFMLLLGLGNGSKILLILTVILFQILLAARDGVKEIPARLYYSVKSLGLSKLHIYTEMVIPAVLPKIISAIRISIGISISVLFFAENYATAYGMGYFIMNAWAIVNYADMFAGILALSLMGLLIFKLVDVLERKLCPWIYVNKTEGLEPSDKIVLK